MGWGWLWGGGIEVSEHEVFGEGRVRKWKLRNHGGVCGVGGGYVGMYDTCT